MAGNRKRPARDDPPDDLISETRPDRRPVTKARPRKDIAEATHSTSDDQSSSFDGGPVGYKRPRQKHQFKKGQPRPSGSGRRKGTKNNQKIVEQVLEEKITVTQNGKPKSMTKKEALLRPGLDQALRGTLRDKDNFFRMIARFAPDHETSPTKPIIISMLPGDENL